MIIVFKIYLICVVCGLMYPIFQKDIARVMEYSPDDPYWDAPWIWRIGSSFVPVINLIYVFAFVVYIAWSIIDNWFILGHRAALRFSRTAKHFFVKEWILRTFFKNNLDFFYSCLEYNQEQVLPEKKLKQIIREIIKKSKQDEKKKNTDLENK